MPITEMTESELREKIIGEDGVRVLDHPGIPGLRLLLITRDLASNLAPLLNDYLNEPDKDKSFYYTLAKPEEFLDA